jgi:ATP-binding cassette subfamily F protein 3
MSLLIECTSGSSEGVHRVSPSSSLVVLGGEITRLSGFRLAYYQQNLQDQLPFDKSPLEYMLSVCPSGTSEQVVRGHLGSFGLSGDIVLRPIATLSGGQKVRIVLSQLTLNR